MFEKLIRYFFNKRVKKHLAEDTRERRFVNYNNARSIILLFESDYTEKNHEIRKIIQSIQADGKRVMAWGFINKKETTTAILPDFRVLHHKNADFLGKPLQSFLQELENQDFDLLLDLTVNEHIPLSYVGLYAKAACKAGVRKNEHNIYDFMIELIPQTPTEDKELEEYNATYVYNQIIFYLKSIQTRD